MGTCHTVAYPGRLYPEFSIGQWYTVRDYIAQGECTLALNVLMQQHQEAMP